MDKIHQQNQNWENNGKAADYAHELWHAAHNCIQDKENKDKQELAKATYDILRCSGSLAKCITDNFRRLIIAYHARGIPTAQTIELILNDETLRDITPFHLFKHENVCGYHNTKDFLTMRLSYLKPTDPRWPHKKYGQHWQKERHHYLQSIMDLPYTTIQEQIAALTEHYATLHTQAEQVYDFKDIEKIHKCKLQTIAAINILTQSKGTDPYQHTITHQNGIETLQKAITGTTTQKQLPPPEPNTVETEAPSQTNTS